MAYLDFQPQETPDRDWGRQHFIRLILINGLNSQKNALRDKKLAQKLF